MRYSTILFPVTFSLFLGTGPGHAAETTLDPVIVTATRTAQSADASLASVTVIDREQIERSTAKSLDELLRTLAGVHTVQTGGYGKSSNVYLRGTNAAHTLVLVDGVRVASSTLGIFSWENYPLDNIEKIEVVRGPRASLYGSDAIGGVIQIFTRQGRGLHYRMGLGNRNTQRFEVGTGGGEQWQYHASIGRFATSGIPSNTIFTEDHGYANNHGSLRLQGPVGELGSLQLSVNQAQGDNEQDAFTGDSRFVHRVVSARYQHQTTEHWLQTFSLGHLLDHYETLSPFTPATIETRRQSVSWQNDLYSRLGTTSIGLDYWSDHATKDRSGSFDKDIHTAAVFLQQQWRLGDHDWQAGVRTDEHDEFGRHETWNLAWGHDWGRARWTASLGTGFKAPGINDLFWPYNSSVFGGITYITQGNPGLQPERSRSAEVGLRYSVDADSRIEINYFRTRADDLINWSATQTGPSEYTYTPMNISSAKIRGTEASFWHRWQAWTGVITYTYLKALDEQTGQQLDRRPRQRFTAQVDRRWNRHTVHGELIAVSERRDANGSMQLDGYTLLNLAYAYAINRDYHLRVAVDNVTDKEYVQATSFSGDYNSPGRSLLLTLEYQAR